MFLHLKNPSLNSAGNIDMIDISIRFFCHGESNMGEAQEDALKQDSPQPAKSLETSVSQSEGNTPALCEETDPEREQAKDESSSPSASPAHSSRPASLGLGVFSWSGSTRELKKSASHPPTVTTERHRSSTPSGLSTLQQFHRKKGSFSWEGSGLSLSSSPVEGTEDAEKSPGSPPSQDSAYFSQSSSISAVVEDTPVTEDNSDKVRIYFDPFMFDIVNHKIIFYPKMKMLSSFTNPHCLSIYSPIQWNRCYKTGQCFPKAS